MTSYTYQPLDTEGPSFRLLRLLKGDGDDIQCQLVNSALPPAEDYAAISYTWGGASRPCDISMNGCIMAVTKNAYLALRDVRYHEDDRLLWMDALCIDQSNVEERNQQVQQMGSIYSHAERVLIWLGEPTYATDYAMRCMKSCEERFDHATPANGEELSNEQRGHAWTEVEHCLTSNQKALVVEDIQLLLSRQRFERVWTIQETAHARQASIVCGRNSVAAHIFAMMPDFLDINLDTPELNHCQSKLDIMPGILRDSSWWAEERDLQTLLLKFRNSKATDARDHLYALLDIASDSGISDSLQSDYSKSVDEMICNATFFLHGLQEVQTPDPPWEFAGSDMQELVDLIEDPTFGYYQLTSELFCIAMRDHQTELVALLIPQLTKDWIVNYINLVFVWAATFGHEAILKQVLDLGTVEVDLQPDENAREPDMVPLSLSAGYGHTAVMKLLLETGEADPNLRDSNGLTAMFWAA